MTRRTLIFLHTVLLMLTLCLGTAIGVHAQNPETHHYVKFRTNKGSFTVKLFNDTPIHRDNFIRLARANKYDDLLFHRVIRNFMVQLGGAKKGVKEATDSELESLSAGTLTAEIEYPRHFHKRGALGAARISNEQNPERKSDGIQFYVVVGQFYLPKELDEMAAESGVEMPDEVKQAYMTEGGSPHLDREYTVFGEVVEGMNTILKIQSSETDETDKPIKEIFVKSTEVIVK